MCFQNVFNIFSMFYQNNCNAYKLLSYIKIYSRYIFKIFELSSKHIKQTFFQTNKRKLFNYLQIIFNVNLKYIKIRTIYLKYIQNIHFYAPNIIKTSSQCPIHQLKNIISCLRSIKLWSTLQLNG